jgi:hypothetical protein
VVAIEVVQRRRFGTVIAHNVAVPSATRHPCLPACLWAGRRTLGQYAPQCRLLPGRHPDVAALSCASLEQSLSIDACCLQIRSLGADAMIEKGPPMWSSRPTMLVGIDVSHPQSFDTSEPSIVGIVASMDKSFAQCAAPHLLHTRDPCQCTGLDALMPSAPHLQTMAATLRGPFRWEVHPKSGQQCTRARPAYLSLFTRDAAQRRVSNVMRHPCSFPTRARPNMHGVRWCCNNECS